RRATCVTPRRAFHRPGIPVPRGCSASRGRRCRWRPRWRLCSPWRFFLAYRSPRGGSLLEAGWFFGRPVLTTRSFAAEGGMCWGPATRTVRLYVGHRGREAIAFQRRRRSLSPRRMGSRIRAAYEKRLADGRLTPDPSQVPVVEALARLEIDLRRKGPLGGLLGGPPEVRGVYLWGPPGRGKSILMD